MAVPNPVGNDMDKMKKVAADRLALEAAQRKAAVSAQVLTDAINARQSIDAQRKAEAEAQAQIEADVLAVEAEKQAAEDAEQARVDARHKAYQDALDAEADAEKQAGADADEVKRLTAVDARNQAEAEVTRLEQVVSDRERTLGVDHPDSVAARDELAGAREAAKESPADTRVEPPAEGDGDDPDPSNPDSSDPNSSN